MSKTPTSIQTDLRRIDAMVDEDIVYDDDTGAPMSSAFLAQSKGQSFIAEGAADLVRKIDQRATA